MGAIISSYLTEYLICAVFLFASIKYSIAFFKEKTLLKLVPVVFSISILFLVLQINIKRPSIGKAIDYYHKFQSLEIHDIKEISIHTEFINRKPNDIKINLISPMIQNEVILSLKKDNNPSYWVFKDWSAQDVYELRIQSSNNDVYYFEITEAEDGRCIVNLFYNKDNIGRFVNHEFKKLDLKHLISLSDTRH